MFMWSRPTDNMLVILCHMFCNDQEPRQRLRRAPGCILLSHVIMLQVSSCVLMASNVFHTLSITSKCFWCLRTFPPCTAFSVCGYGNRIMIMSLSCPCCTGYPSCPSKALIRSQCATTFLRPDVPDWLTDIFTGSSVRVSAFGHEVWLSYSSIVLLQHQTALCQFALV